MIIDGDNSQEIWVNFGVDFKKKKNLLATRGLIVPVVWYQPSFVSDA